jgi:hypothetical protein
LLIPALLAPAGAFAQCNSFNMSQAAGVAIDPGTTEIGVRCDDCTALLTLPFPVRMYGTNYTAARVSSNGTLQFTTDDASYSNNCLPQPGTLGVAICPHWDDLLTNGAGEGVFTSVRGSSPNRILNIEWRGRYYSGGGTVNFEVRLFEDNTRFQIVFGRIDEGGANATVGVQHTSLPPTQFSCNTAGLLTAGTELTFACYNGPTGVASATPNPVYACGDLGTTLLRLQVTPGTNPPSTGIGVTADLSSIGGSIGQAFYNDGTHGDAVAGDSTWSYRITVPETTPPGDKSIPYTLADAQGRSTSGALGLRVNPCPATGPDVFVTALTDVNYYGALNGISAYAIGTECCNHGDLPVIWIAGGTQHPLIAQNMYRLKDGRFEQIGQSFLKNAFQSLNSPCTNCVQPPMGGAQLGVGCSDVYGAGYNGGQGNLSPRSSCNPTTGVFTWPPPPAPTNVIGQRLQVFTSDVDPALNPGALYFGEGHFVTADDAQWTHKGAPGTNGLNNASYQRLQFTSTTEAPTIVGARRPMIAAIHAWREADAGVSVSAADYVDTSMGEPGIVARFWVAGKASMNPDGSWHYEYAVQNLNADRAGGGFIVPVTSPGVRVRNIGFHGVFAHSGEPYPNTATNPDNWPGAQSAGAVRWATPEAYAPPSGNNANALRWGTLYNFRFDCNAAPVTGSVTVNLFKPGAIPSVEAASIPVPGAPRCPADFNADNSVTSQDFFDFVAAFFTNNADFNADGATNSQDFFDFLGAFFTPC